jgi:cell division protease FtsH
MNEFDQIIGYDSIKAEMIRFCDVLKNSEKYEKLGVTLPNGILLIGEPGIGKTLMAKCFLAESGCTSFTIRKDKPDGDFTDHIRETFEKARKCGKSIVFLDDMDKFANEDNFHRDAEEYVTVQACIDESRGDGVFVLATVNDRFCLPSSLLRTGRFDKIIEMHPPRDEDTLKLVNYYMEGKWLSEDICPEEIARILTGRPVSDIQTAINDAGINAGFEGRPNIEKKDIIKSILRLMYNTPESTNEEGRDFELILIHEAGHVIVAETLEPGSVNLVSVEAHDEGEIGGITIMKEKYGNNLCLESIEHEIICALGGKAATEVIFGRSDLGSCTDIHKAFNLADKLIGEQAIAGFDLFEQLDGYSGPTYDKRNFTIANEIFRHYQTAKTILIHKS